MKLKLLAFIMLFLSCDLALAQRQWEQTNGPYGANVESIVTTPDGNIYAGTITGIYRSSDMGDNWVKLPGFPIEDPPLGSCKLFVNQEGILFAFVSFNKFSFEYTFNKLYKSQDSGRTWELIFKAGDLSPQPIAFNSQDHIFFGGSSLHVSINNGTSWKLKNEFATNALMVNSMDQLIALSDRQIYISSDEGGSWVLTGSTPDGDSIRSIIINRKDELLVTTDSNLFISRDYGVSWIEMLDLNLPSEIAIKSNGDLFVASHENGIYRTRDNGMTWDILNEGLSYPNIWTIAFDSSNNIFAGTLNGVFRSRDDGYSWEKLSNGLNSNSISSIGVNDKGDVFAATSTELFISSDRGDIWTNIFQTQYDTIIEDVQVRSNGDIYLTQLDKECQLCLPSVGHVLRSRDNGISWQDIFIDLESNIECLSFINDNMFIKTGSGLYISSDDGETFIKQPDSVIYLCNTLSLPSGISYRPNYDYSNGYRISTIEKSTDGGITWLPTTAFNEPPETIRLHSNSKGHVFASTDQSIQRSTDDGVTWEEIFWELTYNLEMLIDSSDNLYSATSKGVFFSLDDGDNWTRINEGLEVYYINDITHDNLGTLYAAPLYNSVWKYDLMVGTKSLDTIKDFSIYPNPSRSHVTINLPDNFLYANTKLDIYNIQGMLVKSIPVMNSQLTVDVSDLIPGPYLVNVTGIKKGQIVIVK